MEAAMTCLVDGNAIVYCEGAFATPYGKTAHGLVRFTRRYRVISVVDSRYAGQDAGTILDGKPVGIPVLGTVEAAVETAQTEGTPASHLVIGLATDGGYLPGFARKDIITAIRTGLNVDSGLHYFLTDDEEFKSLAEERGVAIRDIRKPPPSERLHFFSGKIEEVKAFKVAVLGTDSAVGKRTTAWLLVKGLEQSGFDARLVGTGQTAWLQGAQYSMVLDSLVNDFVAGEIEHAVWSAWQDGNPGVIVIEGQGSLMNPAYPGGFEILAAGRPDVVVLQHAPARRDYDGFDGYPIHPLETQIQAIELLSGKPVVAVTLNHENMEPADILNQCSAIQKTTGLPAFDVLIDGVGELVEVLRPYLRH
jgi:uncharacterized NAD-dependent epimerase/dehydratase family protein